MVNRCCRPLVKPINLVVVREWRRRQLRESGGQLRIGTMQVEGIAQLRPGLLLLHHRHVVWPHRPENVHHVDALRADTGRVHHAARL